ncbi:hypothetical protein LOK49_LG02G02765 [Camellia lanceoleosa]|uniref:Uncharacterized protein n=1 Tax=Camellia lanceoleosa TaxID=1840588 RepID=A0ACC0IMT4_9ERIC|nr:hypothetical protein LOK49_LG02G02765 [Camellia lanceoleosa]
MGHSTKQVLHSSQTQLIDPICLVVWLGGLSQGLNAKAQNVCVGLRTKLIVVAKEGMVELRRITCFTLSGQQRVLPCDIC